MRKYKNLTIIGTSHISGESIQEVERNILEVRPEVVAIELDRKRFNSLVYNKKTKFRIRDIKSIGLKGFLFNLIGSFIENKLGKLVNVKPGSEMRMAVKSAYKIKAKIALIDQDITVTLRRLSNKLSTREKLRFVLDVLKSLFVGEKIPFDIKKVPGKEVVAKLTNTVKKRYPTIYKVLIEERNYVMGRYLYGLMQGYNKIIAVVGIGHEAEIISEIKKWESLQSRK
ncbi:MAG: TraB/GumN family protein [Nanoarchaeota archaeon]